MSDARKGQFARRTGSAAARRWRSSYEKPTRRGWYECRARDDRWKGKTVWRAWGRGKWWIPLGKGDGSDGWLSSPMGLYRWRGPARDIMAPPPGWTPPNAEVSDRRAQGNDNTTGANGGSLH